MSLIKAMSSISFPHTKMRGSFRALGPGRLRTSSVNFCTRCETAIAFAEVAHIPRQTTLHYFDFDGIEIATTRPELLAACAAVAVNPNDTRYKELKGKNLKVPIFGHNVPVIEDETVDPSFGTGAVMICTFGDRQDVLWWKKYNLTLRKAIDRQGKMTAIADKYAHLNVNECRRVILDDMKASGILRRQEPMEQRVGTCWRCKSPIEILSVIQCRRFIPAKSIELRASIWRVSIHSPRIFSGQI
jgi:valyl-tRNA synthetase